MIKSNSQKTGNEEATNLNLIKGIYKKPTANLIFKGEKLNALPLKSRTRQRCPNLLLNTVLADLARAVRQEKEKEDTQIGKK